MRWRRSASPHSEVNHLQCPVCDPTASAMNALCEHHEAEWMASIKPSFDELAGNCPDCGCETLMTVEQDHASTLMMQTRCPPCAARAE